MKNQQQFTFQQFFSSHLQIFAMSFSSLQLSEWNKNDERLSLAVQENDLNKVDSLLLKKGVVPTKLDQQGTTLCVFSYLFFWIFLPRILLRCLQHFEKNLILIYSSTFPLFWNVDQYCLFFITTRAMISCLCCDNNRMACYEGINCISEGYSCKIFPSPPFGNSVHVTLGQLN